MMEEDRYELEEEMLEQQEWERVRQHDDWWEANDRPLEEEEETLDATNQET